MNPVSHPMSNRLFGTDGVRGKAGEYPLDHETVARLGAALVRAMGAAARSAPAGRPLRFLVGRDTRESGEWIERELARGVHSAGRGDHDRRRHPDTGGRLRHARHGVRCRPRHLRVAQSVRGQRHQGLLRHAGRSSPNRSSARSRRSSHDSELERLGARRCAGRSHRRRSTPTSRTRGWRCRTRSGSGRSSWRSTRPTAPRRPSRPGCSGSSASTSRS